MQPADADLLELARLAAQRGRDVVLQRRVGRRREDVAQPPADEVAGRQAEHALVGGVREAVGLRLVHVADQRRHVVGDRLQPTLAVAKPPLPFAQVERHRRPQPQLAHDQRARTGDHEREEDERGACEQLRRMARGARDGDALVEVQAFLLDHRGAVLAHRLHQAPAVVAEHQGARRGRIGREQRPRALEQRDLGIDGGPQAGEAHLLIGVADHLASDVVEATARGRDSRRIARGGVVGTQQQAAQRGVGIAHGACQLLDRRHGRARPLRPARGFGEADVRRTRRPGQPGEHQEADDDEDSEGALEGGVRSVLSQ